MDYVQLLEQFSSIGRHRVFWRVSNVLDNQQRQQAENELMNRLNENFPEYVTRMMEILVNQSYSDVCRQMAGTLFKRSISSLVGDVSLLVNVSRTGKFWNKSK